MLISLSVEMGILPSETLYARPVFSLFIRLLLVIHANQSPLRPDTRSISWLYQPWTAAVSSATVASRMGQRHKMWSRRPRSHDSALVVVAAILSIFACVASSACVPDVHSGLISDPAILQDEAIAAAFEQVQQNISSLFINTTSDGLSFAVVSNS